MIPEEVSTFRHYWRHTLLALIVFGSLVAALSLKKFGQDVHYHAFVDRRTWIGVPNFADVASNLPFLFVGLSGAVFCFNNVRNGVRSAWLIFFVGVAFIFWGSAYYHWEPTNSRLIWDRLPMTVAFMGLLSALLGESVSERLGRWLLVPAVLIGMSSVVYWYRFDDLRFYAWVQVVPLLTIPAVLLLYKQAYSHQGYLLVALGCYVQAKICEAKDYEIFEWTGRIVSGHSLKHLMAAAGCFAMLHMLKMRSRLTPRE